MASFNAIKNYVENAIDADYMGLPDSADRLDRINEAVARFDQEVGCWHGHNAKGVKYWLQGLCGCVNIAFYNDDIIKLLKEWGCLRPNSRATAVDRELEKYWDYCAAAFIALAKDVGVWDRH